MDADGQLHNSKEVNGWNNPPFDVVGFLVRHPTGRRYADLLSQLNRHWRDGVGFNAKILCLQRGTLDTLSKFPNIGRLSIRKGVPLTNMKILKGLAGLTWVDLSETWVGTSELNDLQCVPKLKILTLYRCKEVTSASLSYVGALTRLTRLDLGSSNVCDIGLRQLTRLSSLRDLSLSRCERVTDVGMSDIGKLTLLTRLDLGITNVGDAGLKQLNPLVNLEMLILYQCKRVNAEGMAHVVGLKGLRSLNLGWMRVTQDGLGEVNSLGSRLKDLSLYRCRIGDSEMECITALTGLTRLDIAWTNVSDAEIEVLTGLRDLVDLDLGGLRRMGDLGLVPVGIWFTSLTRLSLSWSKMTGDGLVLLQRLHRLRRLDVRGCDTITRNAMLAIQTFKELLHLDLGWTSVTDSDLAGLVVALTKLQELNLEHCLHVTNVGIMELSILQDLTRVCLFGSKVGEKGKRHLKRLPGLDVCFTDQCL
ncbi:hypothetical protein BSKO_09271 [Bryopsis sp. KO-2023]|nr:hypothetical protein BSKO_09271 [Bryopsis sp. KO-2023]